MVFVWGSLTELKEEKGTAQRREEKGTATEGRKAEGRSTTRVRPISIFMVFVWELNKYSI